MPGQRRKMNLRAGLKILVIFRGGRLARRHMYSLPYYHRIVALEKDLRESRTEKSIYQEIKTKVSRQEDQLNVRAKQIEDMRITFETQLSREIDSQQRLMTEKQDLQDQIRDLQKTIGQKSDNWRSEERDRKLCQVRPRVLSSIKIVALHTAV